MPYRLAWAVQRAMNRSDGDHLLLCEHDHVYTHGRRADLGRNVLTDLGRVGAELIEIERGGDVTYHGPGQLVGYPIVTLPQRVGAAAHVAWIQSLLVETLTRLGLADVGTLAAYPGVWVGVSGDTPRKIAAIGVRVRRGRTMHGFALNIAPEMRWLRDHIVPCGIADRPVTSLAEEGIEVSRERVVDTLVGVLAEQRPVERQDVAWKHRPEDLSAFSRGLGAGTRRAAQLAVAGVSEGLQVRTRKPEWLRPKVVHRPEVLALERSLRATGLVTVCEEAGCPNRSECWSAGTATIMVLGERCTRACGFCLVDTRKPKAVDGDEPRRVAEAVRAAGLRFAVLTMVARDDLADGGMGHVADCVRAIHEVVPGCSVEVLVSDGGGALGAYAPLFEPGSSSRPEVFNHNLETVARLQRAVRPSAGYARSLAVLAAAGEAGLTTKSGLIVGLGETAEEVEGALADLAAVGVSIVTIGQYLRPTSNHLPVHRWVTPAEFDHYADLGQRLGIGHVQSSPLTRSSYHAASAAGMVVEHDRD